MENKMNICQKSKANTEAILARLNSLENETQEEVNFLVECAISSAENEIALAPLMNTKDFEMSELAQTIKKYPDFKFNKRVVFEDYIEKQTGKGEFKIISLPEDDAGAEGRTDGEGAPKKPHSQKRRKKVLLISQKLDECEIFVMASRLTERDMQKIKVLEPQSKQDDEMTR